MSLEDPPPIFKKLEALESSDDKLNEIALYDSLSQHPDSPGVAKTKVFDPNPPLIEVSSVRPTLDV